MEDTMYVLVVGSPFDGLTIVGPVTPNDPAVDEFIDRDVKDEYWWMVPVQSMEEWREDR